MKMMTSRALAALALSASVGAAGATAASAHVFPPVQPKQQIKVVSGSATIAPSSPTAAFLAKNGITVTPLGRATTANGTVTFPVIGGMRTDRKLSGVLRLRGGLKLTEGTRSLAIRNLTVVRLGSRTTLRATIGDVVVKLARLTGVKLTASGSKTDTATGQIRITATAARAINRLAKAHLVKAGYDLGSFTATLTLSRTGTSAGSKLSK